MCDGYKSASSSICATYTKTSTLTHSHTLWLSVAIILNLIDWCIPNLWQLYSIKQNQTAIGIVLLYGCDIWPGWIQCMCLSNLLETVGMIGMIIPRSHALLESLIQENHSFERLFQTSCFTGCIQCKCMFHFEAVNLRVISNNKKKTVIIGLWNFIAACMLLA